MSPCLLALGSSSDQPLPPFYFELDSNYICLILHLGCWQVFEYASDSKIKIDRWANINLQLRQIDKNVVVVALKSKKVFYSKL